jgi:hypothetical protein
VAEPVVDELFPIVSTPNVAAALACDRDAMAGEVTFRYPGTGEPEFVTIKMGSSSVGIARTIRRHGATTAYVVGVDIGLRCCVRSPPD